MTMPANQDSKSTSQTTARWRHLVPGWSRLGKLGLAAQCGIVAGLVAVVWLLIAPWSYGFGGNSGLFAVCVAAGVSLFAAELALLIGWMFSGPAAAMYGMVSGMGVRMMFALLVGVSLQLGVHDLAKGEMILYLLVFYMTTLATETVLLLARVRSLAIQPKVS